MLRVDAICSSCVRLVIKLCTILRKSLHGNFMSDGFKKVFKGGASVFVVVHFFFVLLASLAVEDTNLVLVVKFLFVESHQLLTDLGLS